MLLIGSIAGAVLGRLERRRSKEKAATEAAEKLRETTPGRDVSPSQSVASPRNRPGERMAVAKLCDG